MPDIDFLFAFLAAAAAFSSAVFHSFSGFAGGLVLAVMLAPLLGIKETVPVVATALIISNVARIWAFRKSVAIKHYLAVFLALNSSPSSSSLALWPSSGSSSLS